MKSWQRPDYSLISRMMLVLVGIMALDLGFVWFLHRELEWSWWFEAAIGIIVAGVMMLGGIVLSPRMFMEQTCHPLSPEWQRRVERLAFLADIPVPTLYTVSSPIANAFTVRSWTGKGCAIVATTALLNNLTEEEFDAVMAHELAHIAHHDMIMILVAGSLNLVLSTLMQRWWILGNLMSFRGSGNGANPLGLVMAGMSFTWLVSTLLIRIFSRQRELAADETAAIFLGTPVTLIHALENCDDINRRYIRTHRLPSSRRSSILAPDLRLIQSAQLISFTWSGLSTRSFLSSHPTTKERVARLRRYWQ